ncbi:hypothetical protein Tco_0397649, partial [Tanacetum coccineum]
MCCLQVEDLSSQFAHLWKLMVNKVDFPIAAGMISKVSRMLRVSFKRFISCGVLCANTSSDTYTATINSIVQKRRCIVKQGPCKDLYRLGIDSDII